MPAKIALCLAAISLTLAEAREAVPPQVGLLVEYIEVAEPVATRLQRDNRGEDSTALRAALQASIDKGDAKLTATAYLRAVSGQRVKVRAGDEIIYPTEFDPPEAPQTVIGPIEAGAVLTTPANPTSLQTREAGLHIEVQASVLGAGEAIDLIAALELTTYHGVKTHGQGDGLVTQPVFFTLKDTVFTRLAPGRDALIGVHMPSGELGENGALEVDASRRVLAFVRPALLTDQHDHADLPKLTKTERTSSGNIGTLVEQIELDARVANQLLREVGSCLDSSGLYEKAKAAGEVVEASYVLSRSGQRARANAMHEWIFPISGDPASVAQSITGPVGAAAQLIVPKAHTSFGMRPVGNLHEIDPVLGPDALEVELRMVPTTVKRVGSLGYGTGPNQTRRPRFLSHDQSLVVQSRCGLTSLLSALPADERRPDRVRLSFARPVLQLVSPGPEVLDEITAEEAAAPGAIVDPFAVDADDLPPPPPPKSTPRVALSFEEIEVSRERFGELFDGMGHRADATALRDAIAEDLESGAAIMCSSAFTQANSGQRVKVQSKLEYLYPTEFDPPDHPSKITGPIAGPLAQIATPISGTAWEMAPLGLTLEIDPSVGRDTTVVHLNISVEHRPLDREVVYGKGLGEVMQPIFTTQETITAITVKDGADVLFSVTTPRETGTANPLSGRRLLRFIRAEVQNLP